MKTKAFFVAAAVFALILTGCGGGDHGPSLIVTDIVSADGVYDGDITFYGTYSRTTSNQSPFSVLVDFQAGVSETRGFLTFDLASIPLDASIQRATVILPIRAVTPIGFGSTVLLGADMVAFPALDTLTTQTAMYDAFWTTPLLPGPDFNVALSQQGGVQSFDATGAVIEANVPPPLATLQIRLISSGGAVEIDDDYDPATGLGRAPVLRVEYF